MDTPRNVADTAAAGLCCGCGACLLACSRRAIALTETVTGVLAPRVNEANCSGCMQCRAVCPSMNGDALSPVHYAGADRGVARAFVGHVADVRERALSQSGGLVTATVRYLLESGAVDVAVCVVSGWPASEKPIVELIRSSAELDRIRGSHYCQVPLLAGLRAVLPEERVCIVGLPCHLTALKRLADAGLWDRRTTVRLGLICDRALTFAALDVFLADLGIGRDRVLSFEYRSKARSGWPGELRVVTDDEREVFVKPALRTRTKEYTTPLRCRTCGDKLNAHCDLVFGDAWGLIDDRLGESLVLVRTPLGERILDGLVGTRTVHLEEIPAAEAVRAAGGDAKLAKAASYRMIITGGNDHAEQERLRATVGVSDVFFAWQLACIDRWIASARSRHQVVTRIRAARALHAPLFRAQRMVVQAWKRLARAIARRPPR